MRRHTTEEFQRNMDRAENLINVHKVLQNPGQGRRSVKSTDTLRASVVFMHSALEELIRNLFLWKLPLADSQALDSIPLKGLSPSHRPEKFLLGRLAKFRGEFVENVIRDSIDEYVNHMNINSTKDFCDCLAMIGVQHAQFSDHFPLLEEMMNRRHQIVHQMDRNHTVGTGSHRASSISEKKVLTWKRNLEQLVDKVLSAVPD